MHVTAITQYCTIYTFQLKIKKKQQLISVGSQFNLALACVHEPPQRMHHKSNKFRLNCMPIRALRSLNYTTKLKYHIMHVNKINYSSIIVCQFPHNKTFWAINVGFGYRGKFWIKLSNLTTISLKQFLKISTESVKHITEVPGELQYLAGNTETTETYNRTFRRCLNVFL